MEVEELSKHEEARIQELFDRLDLDKDGKIDIKDLSNAFHQLGVPQIPGQAQVCRSRSRCKLPKCQIWINCYMYFQQQSQIDKNEKLELHAARNRSCST